MKGFSKGERASSTTQGWWAEGTAYAACGWAFLFAALSFFWAAGGRTGLHPLEQQAASNNLVWIAISLSAGVLKALAGLMAVAIVRSWGPRRYRKLLVAAAWVLGVGMFLYGSLGLVSDVLHVTGVIYDPANWKWFFWYLVLWDPWWVLGGVLFVATAWFSRHPGVEVSAEHNTPNRAVTESAESTEKKV